MKLVINPYHGGGREALKCLCLLGYLQVDVQIVKTTKNCDTPELIVKEDEIVSSAYAICRYLMRTSKKNENSNEWKVESLIFWIISKLSKSLNGTNKEDIKTLLNKIDSDFLKSSTKYLTGDHLTIADFFLWATIKTSRIVGTDFIKSSKLLQSYLDSIEAESFVLEALHIVFNKYDVPHRQVQSSDSEKGKYYVTTAINYTNGSPHMGHAYEVVVADVIARYHRTYGRDVLFLTGADEHGQKIAQAAEAKGVQPIELCDMYVEQFQSLNKQLSISNDAYARTTSDKHIQTAQKIWSLAQANGDIYLDTYTGWYNVREETFITEFEAQSTDYKDPVTGTPLDKMEEVSYFFKMSKYQQNLIDHIQTHPNFIKPEFRKNEILTRLKEPLQDLSSSRTTFSWGIPVPNDDKHVMYVWFDALVNYYTYADTSKEKLESNRSSYWPANVHVIGKDILWFHCVVWPCILMSCGIQLPETIVAHGFVVAGDGRKMSKSLGNVIDPVQLLKDWDNSDTFRYFTLKSSEIGRDLKFDLDAMIDTHNSDLADTIGNLVHRGTGLCSKFCNGIVPSCELPEGEPPFAFRLLVIQFEILFQEFCLQEALELIMNACRDTNKYLTDKAPWAISDLLEKQKICRAIIESLYLLAHLLEPFLPSTAEQIFKRLNTPKSEIRCLSEWFDNLIPGTAIEVGDILFVKKEEKKK